MTTRSALPLLLVLCADQAAIAQVPEISSRPQAGQAAFQVTTRITLRQRNDAREGFSD